MYSKILIPLDGSNVAEKVLPYARYLAGQYKTPIELLAVVDIGEIASHMVSDKARFLDTIIEDGVRHLTEYLRGVATTFAAGNVSCTVERGKPEEAIIAKAETEKATLVMMATHGRSGMNRFLIGSVAEKVLRGTSNPVLLVRSTEEAKSAGEARLGSIIVPLDGSKLAEGVLPTVVNLAKKLDLQVELFRAYHIPYNVYAGDEGFYAGHYNELLESARQEAREYLDKKSSELREAGVTKLTCVTKEGFAGDQIIALGRKTADNLIAMSSHGRSGVRRWMLGSVAEAVVRHSDDPVLIVRAG